jgi:serine/threonine-protein kinase
MATVYRARDMRLDRPVALKRPHPEPPGNDLDVRMEREARAAAGLNHPNVVTVYDYGRDSEGPFLVMELVEGPTLQEKAADVSAEEALQIGASLADGLAAIHAAGVVHRDVKPSNVIMSDRGPMLTDFGIALLNGEEEPITDPGTVVATPSYAAPEVLSGQPPTSASDVFSLALVVKQLTAGGTLDPEVRSALDLALSHSPVERPDAATLASVLRDGVPTVVMAPSVLATGSGATTEPILVLTPAQTPQDPDQSERGWRPWLGALVLVGLVLGVAWALLAFTDRDSGQVAASVTDSTLITATSTLLTTTTTLPPPTTTTAIASDPTISEAVATLQAILLEPPRSDYTRSDVEEITDQIQNAIELAGEGETDEAEEILNALASNFARNLESEQSEDAIAVLETIADSIGVEIDNNEDDREDD